jgi:hypothetical protein
MEVILLQLLLRIKIYEPLLFTVEQKQVQFGENITNGEIITDFQIVELYHIAVHK